MNNNIQKYQFNKKEDLYKAIQTLLSNVSSKGNYNLFLHKVYDFDEYGKTHTRITAKSNMKGIFETGLNLSKYSSIQQTSVYKGDLNEHKADDIINYNYPWHVDDQVVVIIAIPFYAPINNKKVDFSTPIFPFGEYNLFSRNDRSQYTMAFDALDYSKVPTEFILGSIVTNLPKESEESFISRNEAYEMYLNTNHISNKTKEQQEEFLKPIGLNIQKMFDIKSTDSELDVSLKIAKGIQEKNKINYNQGTYESDFDFD